MSNVLHLCCRPCCCCCCSSTQGVDTVQLAVSKALGLPLHKVTVRCRRVGGGFGGKVAGQQLVAVAAALAARLSGRQVCVWRVCGHVLTCMYMCVCLCVCAHMHMCACLFVCVTV